MNRSGLKSALVSMGSILALAACSGDDDDDATGGASGAAAGRGGSAAHAGSGGVAGDGTGSAGKDAEGIAGESGTFDEDCKKMCTVVRACEAPEANGAAGSSGGGAGGEAGAPGDSEVETPIFDQCLTDCDFIEAGLATDPCRPEFEAYFACQGSIDADAVECADGIVRWDLYCQAETAALMECQEF
jgi:hypothetical protein